MLKGFFHYPLGKIIFGVCTPTAFYTLVVLLFILSQVEESGYGGVFGPMVFTVDYGGPKLFTLCKIRDRVVGVTKILLHSMKMKYIVHSTKFRIIVGFTLCI